MLGNSLIGNRQLGDSEIGVRAPLYYTVTDTLTKNDVFSIGIGVVQLDTITKAEDFFITAVPSTFEDTITKHDRQSALVNGSPVSLLWRKIAKIINTIWTKTPKP